MLEAIQLGGIFFNHKQTKSTAGTGFPYAMDVKSRSTIWPPRNVEKTHNCKRLFGEVLGGKSLIKYSFSTLATSPFMNLCRVKSLGTDED